jgi:hypothetical protein
MKQCGSCGLCCKLLNVPGLAPAGEWCKHARPGSLEGCCSIYDQRPQVCLGFDCFWRAESWPDWLRPDRCNVMFESLPGVETILISIDPSHPDAWKKEEILMVIEKLRKKGRPLILKTINDSGMFIPDGFTKDDVLRDIKTVLEWQRKFNGSTNIHNRP